MSKKNGESEHFAEPSDAGDNGRDAKGRFTVHNKLGCGSPHAKRAQQYKAALHRELTAADLRAVVRAMIDKAKGGDTAAGRLVLDYAIGRPRDRSDAADDYATPLIKLIGIDTKTWGRV